MKARLLSPVALLVMFAGALLMVNLSVVVEWITFARNNSTASHVLLTPVVTLVLLYNSREQISAAARPALRSGLPLVGGGVLLLVLARLGVLPASLSLNIFAIVVCVIAAFVTAFGWAAARVAVFPLVFLLFSVPPPESVVAIVTAVLKRGSAEMVAVLFSIVGTPHYRQDFLFALPHFTIEIADECSGIRSSIALLLTALLAGYSLLDRSWTRTVLLLAVLPVAILKNGIRIVTLCLLATGVDPAFLTGQLHQDGGVVFFVLSLVILAPVLYQLKHAESMGRHSLRFGSTPNI